MGGKNRSREQGTTPCKPAPCLLTHLEGRATKAKQIADAQRESRAEGSVQNP